MIQGHAFTALLSRDVLGTPPPRGYTLLHGLTAPAFLCGAGVAYGVSRRRLLLHDWASVPARWASTLPGLRRAAWLFALGFGLQIPGWSLHQLIAQPAALKAACAVGPLQLVASCLVVAEVLRAITCKKSAFRVGIGLWLGALLLVAPYAWAGRWSEALPLWAGTWLDGRQGSPFPALPWAAFFAFGTLLGTTPVFVRGVQSAWPLSALGALMMSTAYTLHDLGGAPADAEVYWHAGTPYWLFRAGACTLMLGVLAHVDRLQTAEPANELGVVALFSRHSLVAYVTHLVALYGSPFSRGLIHRVHDASLPVVVSITVTLIVAALLCCAGVARASGIIRRARYVHAAPAGIRGS